MSKKDFIKNLTSLINYQLSYFKSDSDKLNRSRQYFKHKHFKLGKNSSNYFLYEQISKENIFHLISIQHYRILKKFNLYLDLYDISNKNIFI